jgi:mRNA interferase HigB
MAEKPGEKEELPRKNHIISRRKIREFIKSHPEHRKSSAALYGWYSIAKKSVWRTFSDVRRTYPNADKVGKFVVFNVGGNKFRYVVDIKYKSKVIYLVHVLTHGEYDEGSWKG